MTNFELAKYILSILRKSGSIFMSWGPHQFVAIQNGLQFKVNGFMHKGFVRIIYNEGKDLFIIQFFTMRGRLRQTIEDLFFEDLVEVIDSYVEKTADYEKRVEKWLKKTKF